MVSIFMEGQIKHRMMLRPQQVLLLLWMLLIAYSLADADCLPSEFVSSSQRVPLVELYTSEGCSSCSVSTNHNQMPIQSVGGFLPNQSEYP
jgi:hypothetical protein